MLTGMLFLVCDLKTNGIYVQLQVLSCLLVHLQRMKKMASPLAIIAALYPVHSTSDIVSFSKLEKFKLIDNPGLT